MPLAPVLTIGGCGVYVVAMAALHILRRDLSPLQRGMSRYAGGDTLVLATIAFGALAVGLLALAAHLWYRFRGVSYALLTATGGILLVVLTPIGSPSPSTASLMVHTLGGAIFYLATAWAMQRQTSDGSHRALNGTYLMALTLFFLAGAGTPVLRDVTGLLQRVVFGTAIVWIVQTVVGSNAQPRAR